MTVLATMMAKTLWDFMLLIADTAVCDRKIALLILKTDEMEPFDETQGIDHC